jgi:hypothetical protein
MPSFWRATAFARHPYDRGMATTAGRIGMLREKPLHAGLKRWYAEAGDRVEVPVGGYVIDLVRDDLLIEIQTRGFAGMRAKLVSLLGAGHRVRIVHPIAVDRWIVQVDDVGTLLARRRSPRHGAPVDLATELVSFPELLGRPGLEIEVVLTREDELRRHVPGMCWRRRGWTVVERRLVDVVERVRFTSGDDLRGLLPAVLPERFTTADLATGVGRSEAVARQLAYCLRKAGVVEAVGKRGRSVEYRVLEGRGDA